MRLFAAVFMAMSLTACATGRPIHTKVSPKSVHIEAPKGYERYPELFDHAANALAKHGYDGVNNDKAPYRLKQSLSWGVAWISLSLRVVGDQGVIYTGECSSPASAGFADGLLMERCYSQALQRLE